MTDHAEGLRQLIHLAVGFRVRGQWRDLALRELAALEAELAEIVDHAVEVEDQLVLCKAELKEAEKANIEWQKQIDYAQERAEAAETALQDAVEVAEEAVADADRKTEALRKIAHDCGSVYGYPDGARFVARAALGEDE